MKSNKQNRTRANLVSMIALLEEALAENEKDQLAAADYHQSELVDTAQQNATLALREAIRRLAQEDFEVAERLSAVAWFYANFARGILDAEYTEHQLGEDVFLDFVPPRQTVKDRFGNLMAELKSLLQDKFDGLDTASGVQ
ncbi:MAG: hypothetical protein IPP97_06790 [Candidatus Obscuribacter sp.]|nr:hypothetical protein [Candidatus Obscuribacter sp.]MBP7575167.1 hypothetical protein [Candidatus Obscuribacter sp.]